MNKKLTTVRNHLVRNRAKYAVAATLVVCAVINKARVSEWDGFLTEHNLLDTYYTNGEE